MDDLAVKLKALADPHRLNILNFLLEPIQSCCSRSEGVCACDLETFLGLSQPAVSHHMKLLVQAGFINADKRGKWVYYDLKPAAFAALREQLARYEAVETAEVAA